MRVRRINAARSYAAFSEFSPVSRSPHCAHRRGKLGARPRSLVAALVCAALGVPMSERARLLPPAVEALKLPAPVIEVVLVVSGVVQPTWAFTAGQTAQVLRSVLRAGALKRPVVLVIDGLEHVDQQGLEAFSGWSPARPPAS
jgi:hypothetical protein